MIRIQGKMNKTEPLNTEKNSKVVVILVIKYDPEPNTSFIAGEKYLVFKLNIWLGFFL